MNRHKYKYIALILGATAISFGLVTHANNESFLVMGESEDIILTAEADPSLELDYTNGIEAERTINPISTFGLRDNQALDISDMRVDNSSTSFKLNTDGEFIENFDSLELEVENLANIELSEDAKELLENSLGVICDFESITMGESSYITFKLGSNHIGKNYEIKSSAEDIIAITNITDSSNSIIVDILANNTGNSNISITLDSGETVGVDIRVTE